MSSSATFLVAAVVGVLTPVYNTADLWPRMQMLLDKVTATAEMTYEVRKHIRVQTSQHELFVIIKKYRLNGTEERIHECCRKRKKQPNSRSANACRLVRTILSNYGAPCLRALSELTDRYSNVLIRRDNLPASNLPACRLPCLDVIWVCIRRAVTDGRSEVTTSCGDEQKGWHLQAEDNVQSPQRLYPFPSRSASELILNLSATFHHWPLTVS